VLIRRTSIITGITREWNLPITKEQVERYENGTLLQDAFPNLSKEEREFFKTGITQTEWDEHLGGEE
jgi:hypothetical protein